MLDPHRSAFPNPTLSLLVILTVYASSADTCDTFPPRLRLFPLGPSATVNVLPIILNENKSPCYQC